MTHKSCDYDCNERGRDCDHLEGETMGTGRSYHEVYESGDRIPADEIAEWKTDAAEYIPRLFQADPVQFAPMARFLRAALLIVEQLQSDVAQARTEGAAGEEAQSASDALFFALRQLAVTGGLPSTREPLPLRDLADALAPHVAALVAQARGSAA